jgi:predicted DsbA family dithiol-disulfide isomerase
VVVLFAPPACSTGEAHPRGFAGATQRATSAQAAPQAGSDSDNAAQVLKGIPGLDFSSLSSSAQRELAGVLSDEFCYCGCPHTLGACLKTHPTCKHARRMALLGASDAAAGSPAVEIILKLSKYYLSFREPRLSLKVDERLCTGKKEAKVTLVEFSDFQCPHCAAARPILEKLAQANAATMRFCFAPFPLPNHPDSGTAAQAALFARDRGKFWEMHDLLFENQTRLNPEQLRSLASKVGLAPAELGKAIDSNRYVEELSSWKEAGNRAGVDATPTVYLNGRKFNLALGAEALQRTVEDEIEWMSNKNSWAPD